MRGDFLDGEKRTLTLQIPTIMQCTEGHLQHPSTMHNRQPVQYERLPAPSSRAASGQADTPRIGTRNCPCPRGSVQPPIIEQPALGLFWFGSLSVRACVSSRWDDLAMVVINFTKRLLGHLRRGAHGSLDGFKVGLRARCWNHSETEAMVIPWVLDQTIVAMLSSLLPFYVQSLAIRRMGPRWP